jgi:hypothetical protein
LDLKHFYSHKTSNCGFKSNCIECGKKNKQNRFTLSAKFSKYKSNARVRNIEFYLTKQQFMNFWKKPCHYCGAEIETIGLDRIDNNLGYFIDNVVSCCFDCNSFKMQRSSQEFISKCKLIAGRF